MENTEPSGTDALVLEAADQALDLTGLAPEQSGELRNRLAALEKQASHKPVKEKTRRGNIIRDLTVLVAIAAGAWIIVTIINKFF